MKDTPIYERVESILNASAFAILAFIELHGGEIPSGDLRDAIASQMDSARADVMALFPPAPEVKP